MSGKFQKMSLIPHEMVEKLRFQQRHKEDTRPQAHYAMNLDKEMQEILTKDNLTEYDKAMLYMQLLNKYLGTIHSRDIPKTQDVNTPAIQQHPPPPQQQQQQQPEQADVDPPAQPVEVPPSSPVTLKKIIENIPKYSRSRARKLASKLKEDPNFHWDSKGEITINGKVLEGSDIKQIITNASTNPRQPFTPVGLDTVLAYIRDNRHIPGDIITNRNWQSKLHVRDPPRTPLSRWNSPMTPTFSPSHDKNRRNYGWESWG